MSYYLGDMLAAGPNCVKDLDPASSFMQQTLNSSSEKAKESTGTMRRAFIVSYDGNIYDTDVWNTIGPVLTAQYNARSTCMSNAAMYWWAAPVWWLAAALYSVKIAQLGGCPASGRPASPVLPTPRPRTVSCPRTTGSSPMPFRLTLLRPPRTIPFRTLMMKN